VGIEVQEVIADTAYSGKDNLAEMKSKGIKPVVPLNPVVHNGGLKQEGFEYNKDADFVICPAGQHSIRKAVQGSKQSGKSRSLVFTSIRRNVRHAHLGKAVSNQEQRARPTPSGSWRNPTRRKSEFENSDTFKERIRRRPIIEHKNAELKRYHGMTKAKYRGLFRMRIQAILTAFVVNVKRMIKLAEKMQPVS